MKYWFYVQTFGVTTMSRPSGEMTPQREAYDKAFTLACRYSGGRDLIEEMVASNCWLLGKSRLLFKIEMVNILVYGLAEGVPFPRFGIELLEGESVEDFVSYVEEGAREIIGDISNREAQGDISHGRPSEARCLA